MQLKNDILWRIGVVYILMGIFALVVFGQIVKIQFIQKGKYVIKEDSLSPKKIEILPVRGDIIDAEGKIIVTNVPNYNVYMDFRANGLTKEIFNKNVDSLAFYLYKMFGKTKLQSQLQYKKELTKGYKDSSRYKLIVRGVKYDELKQLMKFPIFRLGQNKGGFIYKADDVRMILFGDLAARTIGNLNKGGNTVGIEGSFDSYLSGVKGFKLIGNLSGSNNIQLEVNPIDGKDVITTIDVALQDVASNALRKQLEEHKAHHGTAILMEVETGEIKAIANLTRDTMGVCTESYNYAIGESTEPGSTFKLASLMVVLEDGYVDTNTVFDTQNGKFINHGDTISDSHRGGYGKITVKQVFEKSSNVGVAKIIDKYYSHNPKKFVDRLIKMNLSEPLGLQLKGEGLPIIHYPDGTKNWWSGILCSMSIGYSVCLTPLQILTLYNAVANNGKMVKPKFVKALSYHGTIIKNFDTEIINPSICSKETLFKLKKMLEGVVKYGTAKKLDSCCYSVAGKTGTARIAQGKLGYKVKSKIVYQASFVGYFPADNPKYSCIVVINGPSKDVYYGGAVAAPVFKAIADRVYATSLEMHKETSNLSNYPIDIPVSMNGFNSDLSFIYKNLNIPVKFNTRSNWVIVNKKEKLVEVNGLNTKNNLVPNVVGMGLRDALYLLENMHYDVKIIGKGKGIVKSQLKQPAEIKGRREKIIIELS